MVFLWVQVDTAQASQRRALTGGPLECGEQGERPPGLLVPGAGPDRLVIHSDPLRAAFRGGGESPLLRGRALREEPLAVGDMIAWHGARIRIGRDEARLEPLALDDPPAAAAAPAAPGATGAGAAGGGAPWRRIQAGLLVELGLVESGAARRAQEAVVARTFDPDAAAAELLAAARVSEDDPRLAERSARLMRDLIMMPVQQGLRGARRRARQATRSALAWVLAQFVVVGVVAVAVLVALLLARMQWDISIDAFLDRVIGFFARGPGASG